MSLAGSQPDQPLNVESTSAVAFRVTTVSFAYGAVHVKPQLIPAGVLSTVPLPTLRTVSIIPAAVPLVKVAVTVLTAVVLSDDAGIVTLQCGSSLPLFEVVAPWSQPLQEPNVEPAAGLAINVTTVLAGYLAEHLSPQFIPAGVLITIPAPSPSFLTSSVAPVAAVPLLNFAVTVFSDDIFTLHCITSSSVPDVELSLSESQPLQPPNTESVAGLAINVTTLFLR
ncbi:hypothetical protein MBAV_001195 [Candidatus Magnetobacterium bavaricum]|uniref:Uncharacterized protein n=1 Tax=Candidatus Magnetobacterium bavaricum TaxID=29290 RepID=A0A0F3GXI5_9BACT|nr:hypothetical protein MBAV_001195 [Candidatus Magnetobacterium bavaricum]